MSNTRAVTRKSAGGAGSQSSSTTTAGSRGTAGSNCPWYFDVDSSTNQVYFVREGDEARCRRYGAVRMVTYSEIFTSSIIVCTLTFVNVMHACSCYNQPLLCEQLAKFILEI